jgi:hypothetical protein
MAEHKDTKGTTEAKDGADAAPAGKGKLVIGVGAVVFVALGAISALMAVPKARHAEPVLGGPWVTRLSKNEIQVNLMGESSKRYLSMSLNAEYYAYDESYVTKRIALDASSPQGAGGPDLLFNAMLQDALLDVAATRTRDQVTDAVQIEAFLEDVRKAVNPLVFPVCLGDSHVQSVPDTRSGLRAGESIMRSTMRGLLHEHHILLDSRRKTLRLDDGPTVQYQGFERDLKVENELHECVFVDVTNVEAEFSGEVPCGVAGKVQGIYRERFLVQ